MQAHEDELRLLFPSGQRIILMHLLSCETFCPKLCIWKTVNDCQSWKCKLTSSAGEMEKAQWSTEEMRLNKLKRGIPFALRNSYFESKDFSSPHLQNAGFPFVTSLSLETFFQWAASCLFLISCYWTMNYWQLFGLIYTLDFHLLFGKELQFSLCGESSLCLFKCAS